MAAIEDEIACLKEQIAALTIRDIELKAKADRAHFEPGVFSFVGDGGDDTDEQLWISNMIQSWGDTDIHLFGGDNNYPSGDVSTIEDNWANFAFAVDGFTAYPCLGNHDLDNSGVGEEPGDPQVKKFNYLPGNKRYYHKFFEKGSVDLFVINSGRKTDGTLVEPDGNAAGSKQHQWFQAALAASTGRYKVVMFHHPFVSTNANTQKHLDEMAWPEFRTGVDLILNGHTHICEMLSYGRATIINTSATARSGRQNSSSDGFDSYTTHGQGDGTMLMWRGDIIGEDNWIEDYAGIDSHDAVISKLFFDETGITVEFWQALSAVDYKPLNRFRLK